MDFKAYLSVPLQKVKSLMPDDSFGTDALPDSSVLTDGVAYAMFWLLFLAGAGSFYNAAVDGRVTDAFICFVGVIVFAVFIRNLYNRPRSSGGPPFPMKVSKRGRRIGKLLLTTNEISLGNKDTTDLFEGIYNYRSVVVKRLPLRYSRSVCARMKNLISSDAHQNIARYVGAEADQDFVFVCLEPYICNLNDLVLMLSGNLAAASENSDKLDMASYRTRMEKVKVWIQETELWKDNGDPSPTLLKLMEEMACGLAHLHKLGFVHDLKLEDILIIKDTELSLKLSNMEIDTHVTGTKGCQAREVIRGGSRTKASNLFCLGLVYFFCITGGAQHPFGNDPDKRIRAKKKPDLRKLDHLPEAKELISRLLNHDPGMRPAAGEVLAHPLFWDDYKRLSFLCTTSRRLYNEASNSLISTDIESTSNVVLGNVGDWENRIDTHALRLREGYNFSSVRDLVRGFRNKYEHSDAKIRAVTGSTPVEYYNYFARQFPHLLIEVYKVVRKHCENEGEFLIYFKVL